MTVTIVMLTIISWLSTFK